MKLQANIYSYTFLTALISYAGSLGSQEGTNHESDSYIGLPHVRGRVDYDASSSLGMIERAGDCFRPEYGQFDCRNILH